MKIKPSKDHSRKNVVVEFDEFFFYTTCSEQIATDIDKLAASFAARRLAYNMWEFASQEVANNFVFMYNLADYENKRKKD
jgi:hypothetical protein